jgi:hypothetical protein
MPEDEPGVARIRVRHKYWSDSQIECFIIMMTALAKRYNAEVIDERGGDI